MKLPVAGLLLAVVALCALQSSVQFESKPRIVSKGRDPVLSVRASGALSLMKVDNGDLWVETSFDGGDSFEEAIRVNDVPGEVSSHGESSPQMQVRSRGEFYCLWQTRRGGGDGSALRFARSPGWGESFTKAIDVDASSSASQSFFTMNVSPQGVIYAAWLDSRDRGQGRAGSSAVYIARSANRGASFEPAQRVSLDVCPCCRPAIAFGSGQTVYVSWRGVQDGNIRDIYVAASRDGGAEWGSARRVAEDNWALNGCPHSGATMATIGDRLFVSWHTVRDQQPRLYLATSDDIAQTFSSRHDLTGGEVIDPNHPVLQRAGDRLALVFQGRATREKEGWGPIGAYYREIDAEGRLSPLLRIANAQGSASYPTLAFEEPGRIYIAWTEPIKDERAIVLARGRRSTRPVEASPPAASGKVSSRAR
ncbi:MAG TPA: sialidase family protein [Bryobacteraceae bacterium]|nr:sialidase family protein [Bryobacteraceae bacterium]